MFTAIALHCVASDTNLPLITASLWLLTQVLPINKFSYFLGYHLVNAPPSFCDVLSIVHFYAVLFVNWQLNKGVTFKIMPVCQCETPRRELWGREYLCEKDEAQQRAEQRCDNMNHVNFFIFREMTHWWLHGTDPLKRWGCECVGLVGEMLPPNDVERVAWKIQRGK